MRFGCLAVGLALSLAMPPAAAPQFGLFPDKGYWQEQWQRPPLAVELESPASLEDYIVNGKLQLSLRDYVELVMRNNPDINLQKLNVYEQENLIQAAFSPFDPILTANFNSNRSNTPSNDLLAGAAVRTSLVQRANFNYSQTLATGTNYQMDFTGVKNANNSQFTNFNPSITHALAFEISQPLLRGRGRRIQKIPIYIAESRLAQTEEVVRERILALLFQAENVYWDAVNARETLRVRENGLELARAFLERSRRELELGAISPLDIYQPEQQYATAQVTVTQASYRLEQALNEVRRQIAADLHPDFRYLPVELTEPVEPPAYTPTFSSEEEVAKALALRPEMEQLRRSIEIDDFNILASTNEMRPDLSLSANYSAQGRGGDFFERSLLGGGTGTVIPGGFPDALRQLFEFRFPTYGFGLTLRLPLRNRRAAADLANASIQKKRDLYLLRSIEQQIRQEVLNAVAGVELSKAAVEQAAVARDFAQKRLDAEQQKYDLGVNTAFLVLQAQSDLVQNDAELLAQSIAYRRSMLTLLRATGELLRVRGVQLQYP